MSVDVDALERAFAVLLKEARANPRLAAALAKALRNTAASAPPARRTRKTGKRALDPVALYRREGGAAVRARLSAMRRADILALVKAQELDPVGVSAFTKPRLVEHVVSAARRRAKPRKSPMDY